jgi:hypothetical protein
MFVFIHKSILELALNDVFPREWSTFERFIIHVKQLQQNRCANKIRWFRIVESKDTYYNEFTKKQVLDSSEFFLFLRLHIDTHFEGNIFVSRVQKRKSMSQNAQKVVDFNHIKQPLVYNFLVDYNNYATSPADI